MCSWKSRLSPLFLYLFPSCLDFYFIEKANSLESYIKITSFRDSMFLHDFSQACFGATEHTHMLQAFCHLHTVLQDLPIDHIHAGKIQDEPGVELPFSVLVLALHFQVKTGLETSTNL